MHGRCGLTDTVLHQPSQRITVLTLHRLIFHIQLTIAVHTPPRSPQLYAHHDQAHSPQHKQYETADDHDPRQQLALLDQTEEDEDEDDRKGRDGDPVREIPISPISIPVSSLLGIAQSEGWMERTVGKGEQGETYQGMPTRSAF